MLFPPYPNSGVNHSVHTSGGSTQSFSLSSGSKTHHPELVEGRDFQSVPLPDGERVSDPGVQQFIVAVLTRDYPLFSGLPPGRKSRSFDKVCIVPV